LIEVLIAVVVLAIGITIFGYFTTSFSLTRNAQYDTQSQAVARSFFDALRASWNANTSLFVDGPCTLTLPGIPSGYSVSSCSASTPTGSKQLKTVVITVTSPTGSKTFITQITLQPAL
jgi:Tfp pilus assembly protein PilV